MKKNALCILVFVPLAMLLAQWETPIRLAQKSSSGTPCPPSIAASYGGVIHVVWCDRQTENSHIFYHRSEDGGLTWQPGAPLTTTKSNIEDPQVSIAGVMNPVTHVVWSDDRDGNKEIYYKRSTDWGVTWSKDTRLTNTAGASCQPVLRGCVCCGADARVMWVDDVNGNPDIFYKISSDNGVTWSGDIQVTDNGSSQSEPSFAFCLSMVRAVWTDRRSGQAEIWGRGSMDGGLTWAAEQCLSRTPNGSAAFPAITHAPNQYDSTLQLFWTNQVNIDDNTRAYDVFYLSSPDMGMSWKLPVRLTEYNIADSTSQPVCVALGSVVYMTLKDPGAGILYRSSFDKGKTWHEDSCAVCLSHADAEISGPSIALAGKIMHMAWFDNHTGKHELYYMRNPNGNPVPFE